MNLKLWIEAKKISNLDIWNLPGEMYEWVQKRWSQIGLYFPQDLIQELQQIVEQYLRVMWLDSKKYPARVDLWYSSEGRPVIYEITTWFVDQIGSCISLQQALWDDSWLESLSSTSFDSSVLTSAPYAPEYNVMKDMFRKSGAELMEEWDNTFVYWYPLDYMKWEEKFIPGWRGLLAEDKISQAQILSRFLERGSYILPRYFTSNETSYSELPAETVTKLIFKQTLPKLKWARNTVIFWKWKESKRRYNDWEMLVQEYIPAYRDENGIRYESKVLFMPSSAWSNFMGMYTLIDENTPDKNFGSTTIPNDGYPQWPWIITY